MGTGGGIGLAAVGAIFAFAIRDSFSGVDLTMVGYILMAAGVLVAVVSFAMSNQKRTHSATAVTTDSSGQQVVRETQAESSPPA